MKKCFLILITVFLILSGFPQGLFVENKNTVNAAAPSSPTGSTGKSLVEVIAEPIERNPAVYWYQQDSLKFRADFDGGTHVIADNVGNTPKTTQVKDTIDLTKFAMPTSFKGSDGKTYSNSSLDKVYLKDNSVQFVMDTSFSGVSLTKVSDTKFSFTTKTGNDYKYTDRQQYGKNPSGQPKHTVRYDTPVSITWYGEITIQAEMRVVEDSTLLVGSKKTYKAQVRTKDGKGSWTNWKDVSANNWTSDKASVATVSSSGQVTAVGKGDAKITATWKDENFHLQASTKATVTSEEYISIDGELNACYEDGTTTLTATLYKTNGTTSKLNELAATKWTSSNASIATVSKGIVTFKKEETVTITVTYLDKSQSVKVTIRDCSVPPPVEEPINPPEVTIYGPTKVKAGEEFYLFAAASVEGGTIDQYIWDFPSADGGEPEDSSLNRLYYLEEGEKYVSVSVEDNQNRWAHDDHFIEVMPPTPVAYMNIDGTLKENRKVTIASNSNSPTHFPITESYFTIEPLDGQSINSIYSHSTNITKNDKTLKISNEEYFELLFKETGNYKVYHYVKNKAGLFDDTEKTITIIADQLPKANFSTVTTLYREDVKEQPEHSSTVIKITDESYSLDDTIGKRIWTYKYDANNDGNFNDEESILLDDTNKKYVEISNVDKVGKYQIELEIFEDFGQPTIEEFVNLSFDKSKTERRFNNTGSKASTEKTVEVKNLAPVVSFDVIKKKKVDLQVFVGNYDNNTSEVQSEIIAQLKPLLNENNIDLNLNVRRMEVTDSRITKIPEEFIDYRSATNIDFSKFDYFLRSEGGQVNYVGYDSTGKEVLNNTTVNESVIIIPSNLGITSIRIMGTSGSPNVAFTRKAKSLTYVNLNGAEFVGFRNATNVDFSIYHYQFRHDIGAIQYEGYDSTGKAVWTGGWVNDLYITVPSNLGITSIRITGTSGTPNAVVTRTLIGFSPNISIQPMSGSNNFVALFERDSIHDSSISSINYQMKSANASFIGIGTTKNQSQLQNIISVNGKGKYISNVNADTSIQQMAEYILAEVNKDSIKPDFSKIDLTFGIGDTTHSNQTILESKINSIVKPKLNAEGISVSSLKFLSLRPTELKAEENVWEFYYGRYVNFGWTYPTDMFINVSYHSKYVLPTSNHYYKFRYSVGEETAIFKIYGKKRGSDSFEFITNDQLANPSRILTSNSYFREFTIDSSQYSEIYRVKNNGDTNDSGWVNLVTRKAITGKGTSRPVWESVNFDDYPIRAESHPSLRYTFPTSNHIYQIPVVSYNTNGYLLGQRRDTGVVDQIQLKLILNGVTLGEFIEVDSSIYSKVWNEWGSNPYSIINRKVDSIPINTNLNLNESNRLHFATVIEDKAVSPQNRFDFLKQAISTNSYLSGLGKTAINKSHFEEIIQKNMNRGTFIDNTNIDAALNQYADYIIAEIKRKSSMNELYITLEEEVAYKTTYMDAENDPKLLENWRYTHEPNVFENNMGIASFNGKNMETPIERFQNVGRYQPNYKAKDDPLNTLFASNLIPSFENYRLWSKDVENWYIYVHRKPIADFTFTINATTGRYTITNRAYDLDKQSIDIGVGGGIKKMAYQWREKGQTAWNDGLPTNPLSRKVYEVKQDVEDFQGAKASVIKLMDATGVNKAPIADFEPIPNEIKVGESTKLHNKSYDPNGDPLTYEWFISMDDKTTWTKFSTVEHPTKQLDQVGVVWFKVKATDNMNPALSDESEAKKVTVINNNQPPTACMLIPTPLFIGDKVEIQNCATDPDGDLLSISYLVQMPANNVNLIFAEGNAAIAANGNLTLTFDQHPIDLGDWVITQYVSDGVEKAEAIGGLTVLDQIVQGNVAHTTQWLKNIQKYNLTYPSRAFNLDDSTDLLEFFKGERFMLGASETKLATKIDVTILEHPNYTTTLSEALSDTWNGDLWEEQMYYEFKAQDELTFIFEATFQNGWIATDEVKIKIRDDKYWTQHTAY